MAKVGKPSSDDSTGVTPIVGVSAMRGEGVRHGVLCNAAESLGCIHAITIVYMCVLHMPLCVCGRGPSCA